MRSTDRKSTSTWRILSVERGNVVRFNSISNFRNVSIWNITMAVDWYASVGADGMFPLERQAGVDVSTYLDKQPQMSFLGHFDKMCMKHGQAAMRAEFERILPSMQRGKVIASVDHQTPPDVSMENYKAYVALLHEYAAKITHQGSNIPPCPVFDTEERSRS